MSDDVLQGVLVFHVALVMLERESSFVLIFNSLIAISLLSLSLSLSVGLPLPLVSVHFHLSTVGEDRVSRCTTPGW